MIREAIFSDETASYVRPPEPETGEKIRIRIRTAKDDVDQVFFFIRRREPMYAKGGIGSIFRLL